MVAWVSAFPSLVIAEPIPKPNFIVILCDNLGYGDIGCFGSTLNRTPNIDRMAAEGTRLTSFYSTSGVCTPSRASLMTGCYPRRVGLASTKSDGAVLRPVSPHGLHPDEITIAEVLSDLGYATACIGKWHLGDQPVFLPTRQGFDHYFGIPYSDDMTRQPDRSHWPKLPLMRNEQVIEAPADRNTLTKRYTEEAMRFIKANRQRPFFLYLPHAMPGSTNRPFASDSFRGKSANGPYGDSVEELDWSTGKILKLLKEYELDSKTLVVWTSDNGAPRHNPPQGSNRPLGGWGYSTREGGMRVPCVVRWPGKIPAAARCDELTCTMDLLPTFARLAGGQPPGDRTIDGHDVWPLWSGTAGATSPYDVFYYYHTDRLHALRSGEWKLRISTTSNPPLERDGYELYDLRNDLGETRNVAKQHPEVVAQLSQFVEKARADLGDRAIAGEGQRSVGSVENPRPQVLGE